MSVESNPVGADVNDPEQNTKLMPTKCTPKAARDRISAVTARGECTEPAHVDRSKDERRGDSFKPMQNYRHQTVVVACNLLGVTLPAGPGLSSQPKEAGTFF